MGKSPILKLLKTGLWLIEALLFMSIVWIFFLLSFRWSSAFAGWIFKSIGPLLTVNRVAHKNLTYVFPEFDQAQRDQIIKGMWENLGRTLIEYVHLGKQDPFAPNSPFTIKGIEHLDAMIQDQKPGILMTIHQANWQLGTYVAQKRGLNISQVSRYVNNPFLRKIIYGVLETVVDDAIPKGSKGGRRLIDVMRKGGHISVMMDQKLNEGIEVPFFGKGAMTAPAMAKLALKFDGPIVPVQVIRTQGVEAEIIFYPPLVFDSKGSEDEKVYQMLVQMNQTIESFVRAHPEQWFWFHRRWPKEFYKERKAHA